MGRGREIRLKRQNVGSSQRDAYAICRPSIQSLKDLLGNGKPWLFRHGGWSCKEYIKQRDKHVSAKHIEMAYCMLNSSLSALHA